MFSCQFMVGGRVCVCVCKTIELFFPIERYLPLGIFDLGHSFCYPTSFFKMT